MPESEQSSVSKISSKTFNVIPTPTFQKEAKSLQKKYPHIGDDIRSLADRLKIDPTSNTPLGKSCYKVRMQITDKHCGKSGGARIIIQVKIIDHCVYLLSIYDKGEKENLLEGELERLLKQQLSK